MQGNYFTDPNILSKIQNTLNRYNEMQGNYFTDPNILSKIQNTLNRYNEMQGNYFTDPNILSKIVGLILKGRGLTEKSCYSDLTSLLCSSST